MSAVLKALAAPRRREILRLVWDQEQSAGEIHRALPEITFGAVSQHLGVLSKAGLVELRREGRQHYYRARSAELGALGGWLEAMWDDALGTLGRLAESEAAAGNRPTASGRIAGRGPLGAVAPRNARAPRKRGARR